MNQEKIGKFIVSLRKEKNITQEELIELKDTIERLIEYNQNEKIDKNRIWKFNLKIGVCILVLAILNNYIHFLGIIFTPNIEEFVQGALYGIGVTYELISVYNVSHEITIKDKKKQLIKKLKNNK